MPARLLIRFRTAVPFWGQINKFQANLFDENGTALLKGAICLMKTKLRFIKG